MKNVLVADDDKLFREVYRNQLSEFNLSVVGSEKEAIEAINTVFFDYVLTDYQMENLDSGLRVALECERKGIAYTVVSACDLNEIDPVLANSHVQKPLMGEALKNIKFKIEEI